MIRDLRDKVVELEAKVVEVRRELDDERDAKKIAIESMEEEQKKKNEVG